MNRSIPHFCPKTTGTLLGLSLFWVVILMVINLITTPAYSQDVIWGVTAFGGTYNRGTLFKIASDSTDFTVVKHFEPFPDGSYPNQLLEGSDGNLYGLTTTDGGNGGGTIFKIDTNGTGFTILHTFNGSGGSGPEGLIESRDGNLYGSTYEGGAYGFGTIFKITTNGMAFSVLHSFNGLEGNGPLGSLLEGSDGNLYGCTYKGGLKGVGTIFKISTDGTAFTMLKSFNGAPDGATPFGGLIEVRDGNLYGMTSGGGITNDGTIFKITFDGSDFAILHSFKDALDGKFPIGKLLEARNSNLYGITGTGGVYTGGTFFKINSDGTGFTALRHFIPEIDGFQSLGSPIEAEDGNVYGTTQNGGISGGGTFFKLAADGSSLTILKNFSDLNYIDGVSPSNLVIQKDKILLPALQINFQNQYSKTPQNWIKDYGLPFREKSVADSTLIYGWKQRSDGMPIDLSVGGPFPGNGRWRPAPADPLLATLMHMQGDDVKNFRGVTEEAYWEMQVGNGEYRVIVSVGDGTRHTLSDPEFHSINVEEVPAITQFIPLGRSGSLTRFKQATVKVSVNDGLLTINADGGTNTKINYLIIQPLDIAPSLVSSQQSSKTQQIPQPQPIIYPNPFSDKLTIETKLRGKVSVWLYDLMGNTHYQANHQLEIGELPLEFSDLSLKAGIYLIKLQAQDGTIQLSRVIKK